MKECYANQINNSNFNSLFQNFFPSISQSFPQKAKQHWKRNLRYNHHAVPFPYCLSRKAIKLVRQSSREKLAPRHNDELLDIRVGRVLPPSTPASPVEN
ncbi:hypothetical protein CEXT_687201 [Caerostris extrusa]|uniref:Uncharacterized protein n=1 Tax=Caerostris extrusa TaxID=172846 RepID=A0AAV4NBT0_CAEEX|nr:hypothetical protein CEXT_687201 [Caerostris extrusa]